MNAFQFGQFKFSKFLLLPFTVPDIVVVVGLYPGPLFSPKCRIGEVEQSLRPFILILKNSSWSLLFITEILWPRVWSACWQRLSDNIHLVIAARILAECFCYEKRVSSGKRARHTKTEADPAHKSERSAKGAAAKKSIVNICFVSKEFSLHSSFFLHSRKREWKNTKASDNSFR